MAARGRKKTRGRKTRRGYQKKRRASQATRGVAMTLSMRELRKLLDQPAPRKKSKKKKKAQPRRRSIEDAIYDAVARRSLHDERPPGSKVSDSRCLTCGARMYERDKGAYTEFYCPSCDAWSRAIRMPG